MITPKNIIRHELIGLEVEITSSKDSTLEGLKGRIIDETQNTLVIEAAGKRKQVAKAICTFHLKIPGALVEVKGRALVGRPQNRIKK